MRFIEAVCDMIHQRLMSNDRIYNVNRWDGGMFQFSIRTPNQALKVKSVPHAMHVGSDGVIADVFEFPSFSVALGDPDMLDKTYAYIDAL